MGRCLDHAGVHSILTEKDEVPFSKRRVPRLPAGCYAVGPFDLIDLFEDEVSDERRI
jgi:hypothetical protein